MRRFGGKISFNVNLKRILSVTDHARLIYSKDLIFRLPRFDFQCTYCMRSSICRTWATVLTIPFLRESGPHLVNDSATMEIIKGSRIFCRLG